MLDNIIHVWCLSITQPSTISVTTRSEFLNESESGGSGGSWSVLKHPGLLFWRFLSWLKFFQFLQYSSHALFTSVESPVMIALGKVSAKQKSNDKLHVWIKVLFECIPISPNLYLIQISTQIFKYPTRDLVAALVFRLWLPGISRAELWKTAKAKIYTS